MFFKQKKVNNPTDDILCTVNNNFVNTADNESFNTVNKEFLDENKYPSQLSEHEVNTNIIDIGFIVNCSTKSTDRVISNTDNTSDEEVLNENYLENFIQEFKTLIANVEDFQNKNRENFNTNNICVPEHSLENKPPNWFTSISDSEVWKKGTVLIVGDSVLSGLRESKMSFRRNIKVRFFPGARIQDMYYYLVPLLRKRPDKIILHEDTNDAPHMKVDEMLEELVKLKSLICEMLPSVKIVLSAPTIRVDKHNANESNIDFTKLLETNYYVLIKHANIKENHLDRYDLHLNHDGTRVLAKNLRLCAQKY